MLPPMYGWSLKTVPMELSGTRHLRAGFLDMAADHCVYATYEPPCMQIFPADQGCLTIHSSAAAPSAGSLITGVHVPSERLFGSAYEVPRAAWNTRAYPRAA